MGWAAQLSGFVVQVVDEDGDEGGFNLSISSRKRADRLASLTGSVFRERRADYGGWRIQLRVLKDKEMNSGAENYRGVTLRCVFVAIGSCCGPRHLSALDAPQSSSLPGS